MDFTALLGSNTYKGEHFTAAKTHPWMDFTALLGSHFPVAKTHTWADALPWLKPIHGWTLYSG